ncbi:MAG: DEAD/DEAH box helicase [Propionicimonas sp.]|uniref:DEAD/DEAH box helicase n=1 Tax=Propionicimonas sp. TaxID=1955623 RepID=UPI002B21F19E|nr:DEAD/DEAH box helicase [Propionicimonas sp.]MEA4945597.1 DEAD/DEAH box helicase [Propionicimonas sp.]MEA5055267.1 DEAD/DEAH box helicase [Propionicimonas sp.]
MSESVVHPSWQLSPAFPGRAAWGTASRLRAWQEEALARYRELDAQDFLAVATPGAGKTTFALRVASELLADRRVEQVIVVAPTEHLKVQWAEAAAKAGIQLDPGLGGSRKGRSRQYHGMVVTYAGVAVRPFAWEALTVRARTLVIFDELHHAGDNLSWGDAVAQSFALATRRLGLTGTPFRSDATPIPFVRYAEEADGTRRSVADYSYGYAEALRDHVVRPVVFMAYGGGMRWRTKAGDELAAGLGEPLPKDITAQAWRTALDPKGEWIAAVLASADTRLTEVRRHLPDAGGLVIASDQRQARAYARALEGLTGEKPAVVLSDDTGSSRRIEEFSCGEDRWMVAVRMVSEGVDVPRLAVGVYATAVSTPLFFAQAVGRFVRSRRRGELATVFLPTVPILLAHAGALERQRDHVLGRPKHDEDLWAPEEALLAEANRSRDTADADDGQFEALESQAIFDHVMFEARQFGMNALPSSDDEADYLGLPGLLEPDQVASLLAERQRRQLARHARQERRERVPETVSLHRALETRRKELNSLVSQLARVRGIPHSHVHAGLRREAGGPPLAQATTEQIETRIALARRWLAAS